MTIMLEVGDIDRFTKVGNFVSYCRCVPSQRLSDGKSKGVGNRKNGNRYLSWAFTRSIAGLSSQFVTVKSIPVAGAFFSLTLALSLKAVFDDLIFSPTIKPLMHI
jgi:transposase